MRNGLRLALVAGILITAACGDDDDPGAATDGAATAGATTTAPADTGGDGYTGDGGEVGGGAAEPVTGPTELSARDQSGDGTTVEVASVTLPIPGFIAVHADDGGRPGPVIGHSDLLPEGRSTDVVVTLDEPLTADATVHPMAHVDANSNERYDFDPPDVTDDVPATSDGDAVATVAVAYTVDAAAGTAGREATAGAEVQVADFAFTPASVEVAVGTTVTWSNRDGVAHTVTAGTPGSPSGDFDEALPPDSSASVTFDSAGTFAYFCALHPSMRGEVVVS